MVFSQRWCSATMAVVAAFCTAASARAATITGVVETGGADPKPIHGASVVVPVFNGTKFDYSTPVLTDEQGRFSLTTMEGSANASAQSEGTPIIVSAPGYGLTEILDRSGKDVVIRLTPELVLHGRVLDAAGKPVAGATVVLSAERMMQSGRRQTFYIPSPLEKSYTAVTDADGRWQLGGATRPEATTAPTNARTTPSASVTLHDPRFVTSLISIPLDNPKDEDFVAKLGGAISGKLVDASGKGVEGAIVSARTTDQQFYVASNQYDQRSASANSGPDGAFTLPPLPAGTYSVEVGGLDSHGQALPLVAMATTAVVVSGKATALAAPMAMVPGAIIQGTVINKATNQPVSGVQLYAYGPQHPRNRNGGWSVAARTDETGQFSLRVAPGDNEIHIGSRETGYAYFDPALSITVGDGETKTLPPIALPVALHVTMKVSDESGKPVPSLPVILQMPDIVGYDWDNAARTDDQGLWDSSQQFQPELSSEEKRPWVIKVGAGWDVVSPKDITLLADSPIAVVVRKADLSTHPRGRVVTPDGKPIAGANVYYSSFIKNGSGDQTDYQSENITSDADGRFVFPPFRPGSTSEVSVNKGDFHRPPGQPYVTIVKQAADAKQPDLGDIVLVPLTGSVSGTVVDAAGKPAAGVWLWSPEGDQRALARTDAGGKFTMQHLPPDGTVTVHAAGGRLVADYQGALSNSLHIQLPAVPQHASETLAVRNRRRGLALLAELAHENGPAQNGRNDGNGGDTLADLLAPIDLDIALHVAAKADGTMDEKVAGGLIENALPVNPVRARELFVANRGEWHDPEVIFFRLVEMATAFAIRDPAFANDCYGAATKMLGDSISADSTWHLLNLVEAAFRLNAPGADDMAQKAIAAVAKERGGNLIDATANVAENAAEGDGVRAAALVATLPVDKRSQAAAEVLYGMAPEQPLEAKKLLDGWIADGTLNPANDRMSAGRLSGATVRLVKSLVAHDASVALAVAKKAPESIGWEAMFWAASGQTDPAARADLYRKALAEGSPWDSLERDAECIYFARRTHDAAIAAEAREQLTASVQGAEGIFNGNAVDNAARFTLAMGGDMPDLCRMILEMSMQQTLDMNPENNSDFWMIKSGIQAMALIDPDHALQIVEKLHGADSAERGKEEIIRVLLTPPDKLRDLVGDPQY